MPAKNTLRSRREKGMPSLSIGMNDGPTWNEVEDWGRHFIREDVWVVHVHTERCFAAVVIKELQIKTASRYRGPRKHWRGRGGTAVWYRWDYEPGCPLGKTVWQVFVKPIVLTRGPRNPAAMCLPRDTDTYVYGKTRLSVHMLLHYPQNWERPKRPSAGRWLSELGPTRVGERGGSQSGHAKQCGHGSVTLSGGRRH